MRGREKSGDFRRIKEGEGTLDIERCRSRWRGNFSDSISTCLRKNKREKN